MTQLRALTSADWPTTPEAHAEPVIILLHGYGSHEHDLAGLAPMLPPGISWASLRAPREMGYGGAAWFPLLDLDDDPRAAPVDAATDALWEWLDEHVPAPVPLIPLGFSQGGFMALQLLRSRPERIAATVVLAGFTTGTEQPADRSFATNRPTVFWGRGDADSVIPPAMVARTSAWLKAHTTVREHVYPGLAHGIHGDMMADVRDYISVSLATPGL